MVLLYVNHILKNDSAYKELICQRFLSLKKTKKRYYLMEWRAEMTSLTHEFAVIDNNELNKNTGKFIIYDKKLLKHSIIYIHDDILCLFIDKLKDIKFYDYKNTNEIENLAYMGMTYIHNDQLLELYNRIRIFMETLESKEILRDQEGKKLDKTFVITELKNFLDFILSAKHKNMNLIHFGI